jgi:peroxiredoxin
MANALTGDFDVVAEFAVAAANRVLAAMHRLERFPHSLAIRVDDTVRPRPDLVGPSIVASIDAFGDPVVNPHHIGTPNPVPGEFLASDAAYSALDPIVNVGVISPPGATVPSLLKGTAQLQVFPPTIEVADGSGKNVRVRIEIIVRYFPDPQTSQLAEFIRGELQIIAAVNQVASQTGNVVDIDVKADSVWIGFTPTWSSRPLVAEDLAGIELLVRNALKTSFLPSNATLPPSVRHMQFKTMFGPPGALAVLLNEGAAVGNPASAHNVFLGSGDDFAFAASADFIHAAFQPTIDNILSQPIDPVSFVYDTWIHTWHITYTITLSSITLDLENGDMALTIKGHAHTGTSWMPDFDFTVRQLLGLGANGATADLIMGDSSLDTSSWVVNLFKGPALDAIRKVRDGAFAQSGANGTVNEMLNANSALGGLLDSLLQPISRKATTHYHPAQFKLAYTSIDITTSGIIMHGTLSVTQWPAPYVEFERIPAVSSGGLSSATDIFSGGPDYSALKTWIPGGTVQHYEWSTQGQPQPFLIDGNKFVYIHPPPQVVSGAVATTATDAVSPLPATVATDGTLPGYSQLCLTVRGMRLSASGPVVAQPVAASVCGFNRFPIVDGLEAFSDGSAPLVALAHAGPQGLVEISGHTTAATGSGAPNLIVHFADDKSASNLGVLTQALTESGRTDAATAILCVLSAGQLAKSRYVSGVVYSDDESGSWERVLRVRPSRRPITFIMDPKRNVLWQHEGEIDSQTLAAALRKSLVAAKPVRVNMLASSARIGQAPPNFLFEFAPGNKLTLRKLIGRAAVLVFWKSSSKQSIQRIRDLQQDDASAAAQVLLAINDGDSPETAKRAAAENRLTANLVTDPAREIARAYGVTAWPTTVFIDALGLVAGVRYGLHDDPMVAEPHRSNAE